MRISDGVQTCALPIFFGYRVSANGQTINTGGNGPLLFPVAPGVSVPFTLFTAASDAKRSYLTDEFQILGTLFDEIGRASCRERVCPYVSISVVAVSLKKQNK